MYLVFVGFAIVLYDAHAEFMELWTLQTKKNKKMTENEKLEFFGDINIQKNVELLWARVFEASNKVIKDAEIFGFELIGFLPNPNIHQLLMTLSVISDMLERILMLSQTGKLELGNIRLIFNAKQQILTMEQIATALNNDDRVSYDEAVDRLAKQAPF